MLEVCLGDHLAKIPRFTTEEIEVWGCSETCLKITKLLLARESSCYKLDFLQKYKSGKFYQN